MLRPIGRVALGAGILTAAFGLASSARAADYSADGPVATTTTDLPATDGATGGNVVVPNAAGTYPLLITTHGFAGSAAYQLGWAQHFASYGFVVVVPSLPSPLSPNEDVDAKVISDLVATFSAPPSSSPAFGKVDAKHVGLEGHSAGGLATTMASTTVKPGATVLFDPVDNGGVGVGDVPKLCSPLLEIFADPTSCNSNEGWDDAHAVSLGDQIKFHVVGASHCDGENPVQVGCSEACGAPATARQDEFARYATAFFLAYLKDDAAAKAAITASALSSDSALSGSSVTAGANCDATVTTTDGGTPIVSDGGPGTSGGGDGGPGSSGSADGGAKSEPGDGATATNDSSGCACNDVGGTNSEDRGTGLFLSAIAVGAVLARRVKKARATKTNR